ncbi:hypothetical protein BC332_20802 [Capsicum chinense]|nr:hypothetical protein BC332_20802 [Capsicum chinense]
MRRYFLQSTNEVDKEVLVERFLKENFETIEDALQMENILKQRRQADDPSDNVVDVAGLTSADSPEKETDKSVEWRRIKSTNHQYLSKMVNKMKRDYGGFVVVYAEYLSEGLGIPSSGIDAQYHRWRYAGLLCKYGSEKEENGYFSENDDPPKPRSRYVDDVSNFDDV